VSQFPVSFHLNFRSKETPFDLRWEVGMEAIIALLALVAQNSMRQDAIIAALEKKGIVSRADIDAEMPKTEVETGRKFDRIKNDFFELWSEFDGENGA
jgi:hypothetical protein